MTGLRVLHLDTGQGNGENRSEPYFSYGETRIAADNAAMYQKRASQSWLDQDLVVRGA